MTWSTLLGRLAAVESRVESMAETAKVANREVETFRQKMQRLRNERRANTLDALLEQPLFWQYLDLLAVDANHPELNLHENLLRRMFGVDQSIFSDLRKKFADVQREVRRAQRGSYRGLSGEQVQGILDDVRGLE